MGISLILGGSKPLPGWFGALLQWKLKLTWAFACVKEGVKACQDALCTYIPSKRWFDKFAQIGLAKKCPTVTTSLLGLPLFVVAANFDFNRSWLSRISPAAASRSLAPGFVATCANNSLRWIEGQIWIGRIFNLIQVWISIGLNLRWISDKGSNQFYLTQRDLWVRELNSAFLCCSKEFNVAK